MRQYGLRDTPIISRKHMHNKYSTYKCIGRVYHHIIMCSFDNISLVNSLLLIIIVKKLSPNEFIH